MIFAVVGVASMTAKGWYPSLSPEKKKEYNRNRRKRYHATSEEMKKLRAEKRKAREQKYFENLSPEDKKQFLLNRVSRWDKFNRKLEATLSSEEKEAKYKQVLNRNMNRYNSLTEKQKTERLQNFSLYAKNHRQKLRNLVISHYSNGTLKCCKCGFSDIRALCVDHINGGGRKHSQELGGHVYEWIVKNNYPENMFQILCQNCNIIKKIENKEDYAPRQKRLKKSAEVHKDD
jgi:hypothetical protein